jgi:hypothetical protein
MHRQPLQTLIDRIEEQIRAARKRQHTRLVAVLIDSQCVVRHYRAQVVASLQRTFKDSL